MKYLSFLSLVILLFSLNACEETVAFKSAVPPDAERILEIPEEFTGLYNCQSDSSLMTIHKDIIVLEDRDEVKQSLDYIMESEDCLIKDGMLYFPGIQECISFEYVTEDTIKYVITNTDTLFSFAQGEIAKFQDGILFLNISSVLNEWYCFTLSQISGDELVWNFLKLPKDYEQLQELAKNIGTRDLEDGETKYIIDPTSQEFKNIMKRNFLEECDVLSPINFEM